MKASYETIVIGHGNHASIEIPESVLLKLGGNKRAPLLVTINGYTYQSTATGVDGKCMVVFPSKDREAAGAKAGDTVEVTLKLDSGYRYVEVPRELLAALNNLNLTDIYNDLNYSTRKEYARKVSEAKTIETKTRRIEKIVTLLEART